MEIDEVSDQKSDIYPNWMAAYAHLKNEFTEDEKYHNLMRWLNCSNTVKIPKFWTPKKFAVITLKFEQ